MKRVCYVSCCGKVAHGKCGERKRGKDKEKEASGNRRRLWFNRRYLLKLVGLDGGAKGVEKICEDNHIFIYAHVYLAAYANADGTPDTYQTIETLHKKTQTNTNTHTHTHRQREP